MVAVMRALDDGLKRNPRLEMKDLDTRLADFAQEVPQEQIDEGRVLLQEGQKALTALELDKASRSSGRRSTCLSKVLPYIKKQELADAMMALGAAYFENAEKKEARATFSRLLDWRSDYKVDLAKYPPAMLSVVEDVRKDVEKAQPRVARDSLEPGAAQAYVDGKYVGRDADVRRGAGRRRALGDAEEGRLQEVGHGGAGVGQGPAGRLDHDGAVDEVSARRAGAGRRREVARRPTLDASAENLKEVLFIDHAVFVRARRRAARGRSRSTASCTTCGRGSG